MATSTPKPEVITDLRRCLDVVSDLMQHDVIAMDAEGLNLGKDGTLTLLQLGTNDHQVYLFDVHVNTRLFTDGKLQDLLTSPNITKVIHSCSGVSAALNHQFGIRLQCVFDTQIAHIVIEEDKGRALASRLKLEKICKTYSETATVADKKTSLKDKWMTEAGNLWAQRPLSQALIEYAAGDVTALVPEVYDTQKRYIEEHNLQDKLKERIWEEIMISVDPTMATQRRDRVAQTVNRVLTEFNRHILVSTKYCDITDEDVITALKRIDTEEAKKISTTMDRLKTECIMAELLEIEDALKENDEVVVRKRYDQSYNKTLWRFESHTDNRISDKAKVLLERYRAVLIKLMAKKYRVGTPLNLINEEERETLKRLRVKSENDPSFSPVVLDLYWRLMESELDSTTQMLSEKGESFKINKGYFKKIGFFMHRNTSVPDNLKTKANGFIQSWNNIFGRNVRPQ